MLKEEQQPVDYFALFEEKKKKIQEAEEVFWDEAPFLIAVLCSTKSDVKKLDAVNKLIQLYGPWTTEFSERALPF